MMTSARPSGASRWMRCTTAASGGAANPSGLKLSWRSSPEPIIILHPVWPAPFKPAAPATETRDAGFIRPCGASRLTVRAYASRSDAVQVADSTSCKRVVITGGNTGIGFETAKALGGLGMSGKMDIVLGCRNSDKGKAAVQALSAAAPAGVSFRNEQLCLDDLTSVRDFVKRMQDEGTPIDVLVNNAGVMACPEAKTKDGFEYQLGVNHLSHFVLTAGLLPMMSNPSRSSRIVNVSSSAQLFGDINFSDPNYASGGYQPWVAYGQSKLANAMFSLELAKRIPLSANVTSNSLHPGVVRTELSRHVMSENPNPFEDAMVKVMNTVLQIKTPVDGAATSIYLASSPEVEGITGKYYIDCKPAVANWKVYVEDTRTRFWDLSCEMTGESFDVESLTSASTAKVPAGSKV